MGIDGVIGAATSVTDPAGSLDQVLQDSIMNFAEHLASTIRNDMNQTDQKLEEHRQETKQADGQ
jgi:hypothetical protein